MMMLATVVAVLLVAAQDKPQVEELAKKVKDLQKERIVVLEKLVDHAVTRFKSVQGAYEEVLEAQMLLLKAHLDAAENESDRIALYQKAIEVLKQLEKVTQAQIAAGRGSEVAVLRIKARRLEAEIQLEQAKIKEAKKESK